MREERTFTKDELKLFSLDLYNITRDIRRSSKELPYRNPTACSQYGPCSYHALCTGVLPKEEISDRFRKLDTKHPELADVDLINLKPEITISPETKTLTNLPDRASDSFLESLLDNSQLS